MDHGRCTDAMLRLRALTPPSVQLPSISTQALARTDRAALDFFRGRCMGHRAHIVSLQGCGLDSFGAETSPGYGLGEGVAVNH